MHPPAAQAIRRLKNAIRRGWHLIACRQPIGGIHEPVSSSLEAGTSIPHDFLLGSIHGLLFHRAGGKTTRLTRWSTYGITRRGDRWYAVERLPTRLKETGRLISFRLDEGKLVEARIELAGLDPEIHQIDWIGDELFVTDTRNNRIACYRFRGRRLVLSREAWPFGKLDKRVASSNYVHLNSVFGQGGYTYVILHNQTIRTGKPSEWAVLNQNLEVVKRELLDASTAHNLVPYEDGLLICDSYGHRLLVDGVPVFQAGGYLRGLAVHGRQLLVAASEVVAGRSRGLPDAVGRVFWLSSARGPILGCMSLTGFGNLYELRLASTRDGGMSQTSQVVSDS